eukprot:6358206-Ditylum_brightwellii.AAC.1
MEELLGKFKGEVAAASISASQAAECESTILAFGEGVKKTQTGELDTFDWSKDILQALPFMLQLHKEAVAEPLGLGE